MGVALPCYWPSRLTRAAPRVETETRSEPALAVPAYAKINLTFEVIGRRPDGLHKVATVLQTISLADRLSFAPARDLSLHHRGPRPTGEEDLILRAARCLQEATEKTHGATIECTKRIPIAAGLGGGSADAGTTLRALNALWSVGLDAADLVRLGAELGADVPFAVEGGTALGTATGGDLTSLPDAPAHWVVLVPISSDDSRKTADMYGRLDRSDRADGSAARRQAAAIGQGYIDYGCVGSAFERAAADRWPR